MKYNTTYLSVPIFDLDWLTVPIENDNDYNGLLLSGGGGSTKSGVKNQIQIMREISKGGDKYEAVQQLETDSDSNSSLCSGVSSGEINSHSIICVTIVNLCRIYKVSTNTNGEQKDTKKNQLSFTQVGEFVADFATEASVNCSVIVPSGMIITGGDDSICRVWEIASYDLNWEITLNVELKGHKGPIMALSLHSTLPILATASKDGSCKVWNLRANQILFDIPTLDGLAGLPSTVSSSSNSPTKNSIECRGCAFTKNGTSLITIQSPRRGAASLILWSFEDNGIEDSTNDGSEVNPVPLKVIVASKVPAIKLAVSEDNEFIAVGISDGSVSIFNGALKKISTKVLFDLPVTGLKFSPVSNILAACSADRKCVIARISAPYSTLFVLFFVIISILLVLFLLYISYSMFSIHLNLDFTIKGKEL